jgi:hypothetical protein
MHLTEPETEVLSSQESDTFPYLEPDKSSPRPFLFNLILSPLLFPSVCEIFPFFQISLQNPWITFTIVLLNGLMCDTL